MKQNKLLKIIDHPIISEIKPYTVLNNIDLKPKKMNLNLFLFGQIKAWETNYWKTNSGTASPTDAYGRIYVYDDGQNTEGNYSSIHIDHYIITSASANATPVYGYSSYRCNGGEYKAVSRSVTTTGYGGNQSWYMGTTYHTVYHDSNGNCSLSVNGSLSGSITINGTTYNYSRTSSFSGVGLPSIPRYATITSFGTSNITMNSFQFSVSANVAIDYVQHSLNGGAWTDSGSQVITGLTPGTTYSLKCRVRRTDSGLWTESNTINVTTVDLARITNQNIDFDLDNNIVINFTNPSGKQVDLYLESPNGTNRITRTNVTSPYTLTLTTEEKNTLFGLSPTSNTLSLRFKLRTDSNNSYVSYKSSNGTISNANPTFTNFEYEDINTTTLDLTGNNQSVIKGYSNVKAIVTTTNKAVAQKGATMSKYRFVVGEKQIDVNYSDSATVELLLNAIDNNVFLVYAIDSRGNSTVKQISPSTYFAYTKPTLKPIVVTRNSQVDTHTTLTFEGSYFVADFGNVDNDITATYKYKESDVSEWITGTTPLTLIKNGTTYTFTGEIAGDKNALGFDLGNSYSVEVYISDELSANEIKDDEILGSGKPNIAWHKNGIAFGMPFNESIDGKSVQFADSIYLKNELLFKWSDD